MTAAAVAALDDPVAIRQAGRELLSLALLDARNHLLHVLAALTLPAPPAPPDPAPGVVTSAPQAAALRLALHAGWYQEYWIARHLQRQRGEACDPRGARLGGVEPRVAAWLAPPAADLPGQGPEAEAVRGYLAQTLDITLDLLAGTSEADAPLHYFRQALLHEDRLGECLAVLLQRAAPPARGQRAPLWLPGQRWCLGNPAAAAAGWLPRSERGGQELVVPEFEIDAQAVNWQQYAEFAGDGGYDRAELWSPAGWAWLQDAAGSAEGTRRAPRHVAQLAGNVLVQRGAAGLQRAAAGQAAMHVTRYEAEAWCHWAGRRLPTEPEWELAASTAASRGWVAGDVFEWVGGQARGWPGSGESGPGCLDAIPRAGSGPPLGVLRGASLATRLRRRYAKARRFVAPDHDLGFCGFRSCAL